MTAEGGDAAVLTRSCRWQRLLDLLSERTRLSVGEAAAALGVSEATVRRDFSSLAQRQLATRTHGGVLAPSVAYQAPARSGPGGSDARDRIAAAAADLVPAGTVVGFNGGTTTTATARRLVARADLVRSRERPPLTVVTNALNIAAEVVLRPHVRTVTLGGVARPESYELTGLLAALVLDELWLDLLFLGVDGIRADGGATCVHLGEGGVNSRMVDRSSRVVVVAGSEKIGRRRFARICDVDRIDTLVTDSGANPDDVRALESAGVEVVLA